jgi:TldD protein
VAAAAPVSQIRYFGRFGVDERMIHEGLTAAMARGADFADLFFQHRVTNYLVLEDGAVNQAYQEVELGVGVRAVKGDQTGYGYTEELTVEACAMPPRRRRRSPMARRGRGRPPSTSPEACRAGTRSRSAGARCGPTASCRSSSA